MIRLSQTFGKEGKMILRRKCVRCDGHKVIMIGAEMRDCPVCKGSGEGTVYSAPNYASHVQGTNAPEGIQADGLRGRACS